jgi:hypothetical protein
MELSVNQLDLSVRSCPSFKGDFDNPSRARAAGTRKSNSLRDITMFSYNGKPSESSITKRISESNRQGLENRTHFGRHLLQDSNIVRKLKENESRMSYEKPIQNLRKYGDFNCDSVKFRSVQTKKVFPFCEELVAASREGQCSDTQSSSVSKRYDAMENTIPQQKRTNWKNTMSPMSIAEKEATIFEQQLKSQEQPSWEEIQEFRKLGLSFRQILGLEVLGFNVSRFLSPPRLSFNHDPRIPPFFELEGVFCYWCESPSHVSCGVAFMLKEAARVVGVEVVWNESSQNVSLIQIATVDVILLIPVSTDDVSLIKALHIIFRNPEIVKVGLNIETNLWALWVNYRIESNSCVEFNDLLQFSRLKFGFLSKHVESPPKLQAIACAVGYPNWQTPDMMFSNCDCRQLSWRQVRYAARNIFMTVKVIFSILTGRKVSKATSTPEIEANIGLLINSVCIRVPISKRQHNMQLKSRGACNDFPGQHQQNLTPISSVVMDSIGSDSLDMQDDRRSISSDFASGLFESFGKAYAVGHKHMLSRYGAAYPFPKDP